MKQPLEVLEGNGHWQARWTKTISLAFELRRPSMEINTFDREGAGSYITQIGRDILNPNWLRTDNIKTIGGMVSLTHPRSKFIGEK